MLAGTLTSKVTTTVVLEATEMSLRPMLPPPATGSPGLGPELIVVLPATGVQPSVDALARMRDETVTGSCPAGAPALVMVKVTVARPPEAMRMADTLARTAT